MPDHDKSMSCDSSIWGFGQWAQGNWTPAESYPQCSAPLIPPETIYQCLKGKRVFLFGDSMIRPLMGRLVAYLRGIPAYIDHLYHEPGGYYMANGTHDVFMEHDMLPSLHAAQAAQQPGHVSPSTPEDAWDRRATVQLQFYWAAHFVPIELNGATFPALHEHVGVLGGADVVIAGPMYHDGSSDYSKFRVALVHYFKLLATLGKRITQFFWVASIPKPKEQQNLQPYLDRNHGMSVFINMLNEHSLAGEAWAPQKSFYVDAFRMSLLGNLPRADEYHFQCNKHAPYPDDISADTQGLNADLSCKDPFNLNVMHAILKVVCNV